MDSHFGEVLCLLDMALMLATWGKWILLYPTPGSGGLHNIDAYQNWHIIRVTDHTAPEVLTMHISIGIIWKSNGTL